MAFAVFYPSLAGDVRNIQTNETWADLRAGSGTTPGGGAFFRAYFSSGSTSNLWRWLTRGVLLFDTSSLNGKTLVGATLLPYCSSKAMEVSRPDFSVGVFSSNPASDDELVASDFSTLGTTILSEEKAYDYFTEGYYGRLTLNSSGLAAINKTGITKLGIRENYYDAQGNTPPWVDGGRDSGVNFLVSGVVTALFQAEAPNTESREVLLGSDGFLYYGMATGLAKVDPVTMAGIAYNTDCSLCRNLMEWDGFIYYAENNSPARVHKIRKETMQVVATWDGVAGQNDAASLSHDTTHLYVATGGTGENARIIPINPNTMKTDGTIWVDSSANGAFGLVTMGSYHYIGIRDANPSQVKQVTKSTMTTNQTWTGAGVTDLRDVHPDPSGNYIYASHNIDGSAGKVSKIQISDMTTHLTWTGSGVAQSHCKLLYHDGTNLWVPCDVNPGVIVKVNPTTMLTIDTWTGTATQRYCYRVQVSGDDVYTTLNLTPDPIKAQGIIISNSTMTTKTLSPVPVLVVEYVSNINKINGIGITSISGLSSVPKADVRKVNGIEV
jgi:hypothetical protein